MGPFDYVVLVAYFVFMAVIGYWCMLRVKHQEDFFLGGRSFGKIFQTFAAFGAGTGANDPVTVGRSTYTSGLSGIWAVLHWLMVTPFYWIFGVWYRRMRHLTLGDWFVERYESKGLGAAYALFGILFYTFYLSVAFSAVGKVCEPLIAPEGFDFPISYVLVPVIAVVVIVYGVLGGLRAAYWTDLIQGVFIIFLSIILIPFGLEILVDEFGGSSWLDGFSRLHEQVPASYFQIIDSPRGGEFPLYYVVCIFLINLVGIVVQPHFIATGGGSAKNETSARVGLVVGNFLKRLCTVGWALTGLIMLAILATDPELGRDPDKVWGLAAVRILGPLELGLVGLMVACLLAALMSSADAYMLVSSALVVRNWFAVFYPSASEKQYVFAGRIVGVIIIVGAVICSLRWYNVLDQLKIAWEIPVVFAAPFWLGMFWRRATRTAAWLTVIFSATVFFAVPMVLPYAMPSLRENSAYTITNDFEVHTSTRPAKRADVARREAEIKAWPGLKAKAEAETDPVKREKAIDKLGPLPTPLEEGERFEDSWTTGGRAIFWTGGVEPETTTAPVQIGEPVPVGDEKVVKKRYTAGTRLVGDGFFTLDFLLYQWVGGWVGFDLRSLPNPAIDALRLPPRIITPFLVMIVLSLLTRRNRKEALDRFYVKMKTPTQSDPEADRRELEISYENPTRFDSKKLLPRSSFEFQRPTVVDVAGFLVSLLCAFGIIGLAVWVAGIGS